MKRGKKDGEMVYRIADNIISPLGETTARNYVAVKAGLSRLRRYVEYEGIPDPFVASFLTEEQWQRLTVEGMTRFESLAFHSARQAMEEAGIDPGVSKVVLILSTTKGNIELLESRPLDSTPGEAARHIASALGIRTVPITVCNACISGVSAIVLAMRLLETGSYDYAVVCGADILTPFTISGFLSLKALSEEVCRPFDLERLGLNLGEAAATIVLTHGDRPSVRRRLCTAGSVPMSRTAGSVPMSRWAIEAGNIRNDGFHISSPSKNGEGARLALEATGGRQRLQEMAFVNAHGTATMFNDQMESVAIERAGLNGLPVNALKGYFGHTLGAAGVLETILSMASVDDHTILGTKGFEERGVSGKILLSAENSETDRRGFIKMISGFGGCNGAIMCVKEVSDSRGQTPCASQATHAGVSPHESASQATHAGVSPHESVHSVRLTPSKVIVDGRELDCEGEGMELLTNLYKRFIDDYPKYYKMDALCRLGFVASELLLKMENGRCKMDDGRREMRESRAIVLFNQSSSIQADLSYQASIQDPENYFPSPSAFVYTLPNIVTGEIAIRNHYQGETSFYILPEKDEQLMEQVIAASFEDRGTQSMICGWLDYQDDANFEAKLELRIKS